MAPFPSRLRNGRCVVAIAAAAGGLPRSLCVARGERVCVTGRVGEQFGACQITQRNLPSAIYPGAGPELHTRIAAFTRVKAVLSFRFSEY